MTLGREFPSRARPASKGSANPPSTSTNGISLSLHGNACFLSSQLTRPNPDAKQIGIYDSLGQVTSGKRKWQDGSFVAGQQYEYTFDEIGNRTQTKVGGDVNGANLRSASYTPNLLNQYDQRVVPGAVDILGLGVPSTEVRVDNIIASRKGEYFHHPLAVDNSSNPQYKTVSVVSGTESSSGNIFVPKTPEQYDDPATPAVNEGYDEDGNQLRGGRWNYTWDAENRLVKIESLATAPAGSRRRLEFAYDFMGRRIWKKLTNLETSAVTEERFLYDGWNLVAVLSPSSATILKSFVWGTDLSGSFQGAGGVGGLLKVNQVAAPASASFVAYDGNGNVAGLIDASSGTIAAQYEYGPFGEVLRATGPVAKVNPFRFSTKYQDDETDLHYYGYRYYDASTGRWLSRDPLEEYGGLGLYGFVANDSIGAIDIVGLFGCSARCTCVSVSVDFDDGGNSFNWHWIREGKSTRFGTTMSVEWKVSGSPGRCKYYQREAGNFSWFRDPRDRRAKTARWYDHQVSQKYTDFAGAYFYSPQDHGTWRSRIFRAPSITLECQSSDGTKITQAVNVQTPPDPGLFPPN